MWDPYTIYNNRPRRASSIALAAHVRIINSIVERRVKLRICSSLADSLPWAPHLTAKPGQWTNYTFKKGYVLKMARDGVLWTITLQRQSFMIIIWKSNTPSVLASSAAVDGVPVSPGTQPTVEQMSLVELEEIEEFARMLGIGRV